MAQITSLRLRVGRAASGREFAEVIGRVSWTSREVTDNKVYTIRTFLVERDDNRDFFDMLPDGNIHWLSIGNLDDFIGTIGAQAIRPNGQTSRAFTHRRDWDFPNNEWGNEEYVCVATVVPEDHADVRFSNEVSVNLA
jgi:hypothetical protein